MEGIKGRTRKYFLKTSTFTKALFKENQCTLLDTVFVAIGTFRTKFLIFFFPHDLEMKSGFLENTLQYIPK